MTLTRTQRLQALALACLLSPAALAYTISDFSVATGLTLNGSAAVATTRDGNVLRLTPAAGSQSGSAFSSATVNAGEFSTFFRFRITEPGGSVFDCNTEPGADGLVFVVQSVASDIGGSGQGIGYAGIADSVGVELDTWCNAANNDPNSNHVAIDTEGSVRHDPAGGDTAVISPDFDNGDVWYVWVDYDGETLEVRVSETGLRPPQPTLSRTLDIPALLGDVEQAFVGFTAGTGSDWGNHDVLYWEYRERYAPVAGQSPCCAQFDPATGVVTIPCLRMTGTSDVFGVTLKYLGGTQLALTAIGEGTSACCGSDGSTSECEDCSCAAYAEANPLECGRTGDLNIRLTWNDLNDVDLHVVYEGVAGQEEVDYGNTLGSISGGELDVDSNANCVSNVTESPVENIVFDDPPSGRYSIKICGYTSCGGDTSSTARVQALDNGTVFWETTVEVDAWSDSCTTVYTHVR